MQEVIDLMKFPEMLRRVINYIRRFSSTVLANTEEKRELISLTANIPYDDQVNHRASLADISSSLLQQHLKAIGSKLHEQLEQLTHLALCRSMNLVEGSDMRYQKMWH